MYQAEHLDLFTTVQDEFTDDLTRLSGLLETVGEQADALDPIRIRVSVQDRQLRQLQRRIATTQTADILDFGGGAGSADGPDFEDITHTTGRSPSDIFRDSVDDFASSVDQLGSGLPTSGPRSAALGAGAVGIMGLMNQLVRDTDFGGGGERQVTADDVGAFQATFGLPMERLFKEESVDVRGLLTGDAPPFQLPETELSTMFSSRAFIRAFDFEGLNEAIGDELDVAGPRDLVSLDGDEIADMADLNSFADVVEDFTDQQRFRRRQLLNTVLNLRVGMTQFYDILAASIPLLGTFVGSLPALVGALGGLAAAAVGAAGALGGIAGLGLVGAAAARAEGMPSLEDFTAVLDDLDEELFEAFRPLAQRLAPTFEDGLDGLFGFFDDLARQASVIEALEDDARAFGRFMGPFVAGTVADLLLLADASRGVFSQIAEGLDDVEVIRGLGGALADVLPELTRLTTLLVGAIPALQQFSVGMLDAFTMVMGLTSTVIGFGTQLVSLFGILGNGSTILGRVTGSLLVFGSALFLASKITQLVRSEFVALTGVMVAQLIPSLGFTSTVVATLEAGFLSLGVSASLAATAANALYAALLGIATLTGIGVVLAGISAGASYAASSFGGLTDEIKNATDAYREFQRQERRLGTRGGAFLGNLDRTVYVDVTENRETTIEGDADTETTEYQSFVDSSRNTNSYL